MPETIAVPEVGTVIPDLPLLAATGASTLHQVLDSRRAVVFFLRSADCAICLGHVKKLMRMEEAGELRGAQVVLIAPGDRDAAAELTRRVANPQATTWASGEHHADIGLGKFLAVQHSGTFVVDAEGRILSRRTSVLPMSSFSGDEVVAALS
jgi:peroxiredoxin